MVVATHDKTLYIWRGCRIATVGQLLRIPKGYIREGDCLRLLVDSKGILHILATGDLQRSSNFVVSTLKQRTLPNIIHFSYTLRSAELALHLFPNEVRNTNR